MSNASQGPFVTPPTPGGGQSQNNIPAFGIGLSTIYDPSAVKSSILEAINHGYRHIQSSVSSSLEHHQAIGEAIVEALDKGLITSRKDLFITCKIEFHDAASLNFIQELNKFLEKLHLEYVDLYLMPRPKPIEDEIERVNEDLPLTKLMLAWASMEECQTLGLTKSIGVCSFSLKMLQNLLKHAKIPPSLNQVEMHRLVLDKELREFCLANNISIVASSTIGEKEKKLGSTQLLELQDLNKIADEK